MYVSNIVVSSYTNTNSANSKNSTSELDCHTNMIVLDKNAFVFESTGKICNVFFFLAELGIALDVHIVDTAISYDYELAHENYKLIVRMHYTFQQRIMIFYIRPF